MADDSLESASHLELLKDISMPTSLCDLDGSALMALIVFIRSSLEQEADDLYMVFVNGYR